MKALVPVERLLEVPGGRVWTATYGSGPAIPLLVLHGGPGMPSHYLESLAELADVRPVILYDQLGCGRSDRPENPSLWTVDRAVEEVEAVRQQLGLGRMHVLGHSWGGFLALAHTAAHDAGVTSLILSSPLVSVHGWTEDAAELVSRLPPEVQQTITEHEERQTFEDPAYLEATEQFYRRFFCLLDPWPDELQRSLEQMGRSPYTTMWGPTEFTQTGNLSGADLGPVLPELGVPTLWIGGSQDEISPERLSTYATWASGRAEVLDGGSHCLHLEQPERYLTLVRDFLGSVDNR